MKKNIKVKVGVEADSILNPKILWRRKSIKKINQKIYKKKNHSKLLTTIKKIMIRIRNLKLIVLLWLEFY